MALAILKGAAGRATGGSTGPLVMDKNPDWYLGVIPDNATLAQLANQAMRVEEIIGNGYSVAVHSDYRYVSAQSLNRLGVSDAVWNDEERAIMEGYTPDEGRKIFDKATMRTDVSEKERANPKFASQIEALKLAFDDKDMDIENLFYIKKYEKDLLPLVSAYGKVYTGTIERRATKLDADDFAELESQKAWAKLVAHRQGVINAEVGALNRLIARGLRMQATKVALLSGESSGKEIDPMSIGTNKARQILGRPLVFAGSKFGAKAKARGKRTAAEMAGPEAGPSKRAAPISTPVGMVGSAGLTVRNEWLTQFERAYLDSTYQEMAASLSKIMVEMKKQPLWEGFLKAMRWREECTRNGVPELILAQNDMPITKVLVGVLNTIIRDEGRKLTELKPLFEGVPIIHLIAEFLTGHKCWWAGEIVGSEASFDRMMKEKGDADLILPGLRHTSVLGIAIDDTMVE